MHHRTSLVWQKAGICCSKDGDSYFNVRATISVVTLYLVSTLTTRCRAQWHPVLHRKNRITHQRKMLWKFALRRFPLLASRFRNSHFGETHFGSSKKSTSRYPQVGNSKVHISNVSFGPCYQYLDYVIIL